MNSTTKPLFDDVTPGRDLGHRILRRLRRELLRIISWPRGWSNLLPSNERFLREEKQDFDTVLKSVEQALGVEQTKYRVGQVDLDPVLQLQAAELGAKTSCDRSSI